MNEFEQKQRLAAILAADAAGYSRLMAFDARSTVQLLDAARAIFRNRIESNHGRVIDMAGDSVLAAFETASGAVSAALLIQAELEALGADMAQDRRMRFRIGVHLGDVIEKADGTIYGDGVNIAARLENLAEPGGICVSESIHTAVRGKVRAAFEDRGEQRVKNIPHPVRAFSVRAGDRHSEPAPGLDEATLSLPDKPSIAVLPFANLGGDPEQEYFADGMVEDIITELSRFQRLFVIARNTSFMYKRRSVDARSVARELGVHFVLEGSVRKAGTRVRITAQMIDGQSGQTVWAERYEDAISDLFELQERIAHEVAGTLVGRIEEEEMRLQERGPRRFSEADDIAWRATKKMLDGTFDGRPELTLDAIRLAEQAIEKDGTCRQAWFVRSFSHCARVFFAWTADRAGSIQAARVAAEKLMTLAPSDSRSYFQRGVVEALFGDFSLGAADQRRAYELNPNDTTGLFFLSWAEAADGNVELAKSLAARAIRLSPKDRFIGMAHLAYAMAAFCEQNFEDLYTWTRLAIQSHPAAPIRRVLMIVYAAKVGDAALMHIHLEKLCSVAPEFIPSLFRGDYRPFHQPQHLQMLLDSLHEAGLSG